MRVGQGYCIWEKCSDHNPQWNKRQSPKVHVRSIHGSTIFSMKISGLREGRIETSTICRFCDISILEILPPSYLIFAGPLSLLLLSLLLSLDYFDLSSGRAMGDGMGRAVERSVERWVGRRASDRHHLQYFFYCCHFEEEEMKDRQQSVL